MPELSTDLRLLKIQDWVNSRKDDKLLPLITQRCAAAGEAAFKAAFFENATQWHAIRQSNRFKLKHVSCDSSTCRLEFIPVYARKSACGCVRT